MRLQVTQENLSKAVNIVGRVASGKTPLPILSNILLKTDQNRLLLAATNLEIAVTQYVGGKVEEEGSITVPAKLVGEFVSNLPKGNIELSVEDNKLHVRAGQYTSTINGMASDEFPSLPEVKSEQKIILPTLLVKRALQQTVLVASSDTTRPVITGVYAHSHEGTLYFVATDGYRLAERAVIACQEDIEAIIPADTMQEVLRVITDDVADIEFVFDKEQVAIKVGEIHIVSRLIDGQFPPYRSLVPESSEISATVDKDEFVRITKIAGLFARDSGGSVTVKADEMTKSISISSVASQVGENSSQAEATVVGSGQVTLNSRYLLEAVTCIDEKQVTFSFSGKLSACVLTGDVKKVEYKHIVMPLKS